MARLSILAACFFLKSVIFLKTILFHVISHFLPSIYQKIFSGIYDPKEKIFLYLIMLVNLEPRKGEGKPPD